MVERLLGEDTNHAKRVTKVVAVLLVRRRIDDGGSREGVCMQSYLGRSAVGGIAISLVSPPLPAQGNGRYFLGNRRHGCEVLKKIDREEQPKVRRI